MFMTNDQFSKRESHLGVLILFFWILFQYLNCNIMVSLIHYFSLFHVCSRFFEGLTFTGDRISGPKCSFRGCFLQFGVKLKVNYVSIFHPKTPFFAKIQLFRGKLLDFQNYSNSHKVFVNILNKRAWDVSLPDSFVLLTVFSIIRIIDVRYMFSLDCYPPPLYSNYLSKTLRLVQDAEYNGDIFYKSNSGPQRRKSSKNQANPN